MWATWDTIFSAMIHLHIILPIAIFPAHCRGETRSTQTPDHHPFFRFSIITSYKHRTLLLELWIELTGRGVKQEISCRLLGCLTAEII
jgi:hypothetical protein